MSAVNEFIGIRRGVALYDIAQYHNTSVNQFAYKSLHEVVLARYEQRREYWIIIIPTPSPSETVLILHHLISNETSSDGVNTE